MRNALAAIALLASTVTLGIGCVPLGCGGYNGGNDRVLARGNDAMILCENGGFVVNLATSNVLGMYTTDATNSNITHGTLTNTQQVAFTLTEGSDGTSTAPELGSGAWTDVDLDQVSLDHANTQCLNLESNAWWPATTN